MALSGSSNMLGLSKMSVSGLVAVLVVVLEAADFLLDFLDSGFDAVSAKISSVTQKLMMFKTKKAKNMCLHFEVNKCAVTIWTLHLKYAVVNLIQD